MAWKFMERAAFARRRDIVIQWRGGVKGWGKYLWEAW
jgi:hypothetical protein